MDVISARLVGDRQHTYTGAIAQVSDTSLERATDELAGLYSKRWDIPVAPAALLGGSETVSDKMLLVLLTPNYHSDFSASLAVLRSGTFQEAAEEIKRRYGGKVTPQSEPIQTYVPSRKRKLLNPLILGDVALNHGSELEIKLYSLNATTVPESVDFIHRLEQTYAEIVRSISPHYLEFLRAFLRNVPSEEVELLGAPVTSGRVRK